MCRPGDVALSQMLVFSINLEIIVMPHFHGHNTHGLGTVFHELDVGTVYVTFGLATSSQTTTLPEL